MKGFSPLRNRSIAIRAQSPILNNFGPFVDGEMHCILETGELGLVLRDKCEFPQDCINQTDLNC